ncbi:hypothetical protein ElyMa_003707700 [Elysia marginata]|uniref:Teneurin N-terminal domain-containing protein n=1 Tax=Elysia marginata TaxID=1093978 RepID=A0AAV4F3A9_9GAST|nr:hypothetical protein ElyMa_003707700 [Elysia marginata]
MGVYDLMPRKTAAVYRSSEALVSTSSESDAGGNSEDTSTASSACPSPGPTSGRSDSNLQGRNRTYTRRRSSLDLNYKSNFRLKQSTGKDTVEAPEFRASAELMSKLHLHDRYVVGFSGSFSGHGGLCEGSALALRGLERSRSGDFYNKPSQNGRRCNNNGLILAKLRPCFSEGVKLASGRTAFSLCQNSQTPSSNSLFQANNDLHGSLPSHQKLALLQNHSSRMLVSNETLEDSLPYSRKHNRSYSPDSFESGDLRHGKRFLHGLQSCSKELDISEEELTLSNVFQVRSFWF